MSTVYRDPRGNGDITHGHALSISRVADSPLPINHDKTGGAAGFFREQHHGSIDGLRGIESAAQKIESALRHQDANDRLTVAGARNAAVLIGISAAAQ